MRIVAIIQARMGSTRLPEKVLKNICDKTILQHIIERVRDSKFITSVVVATTTKKQDDAIVFHCLDQGYYFFRGSEDNVLKRYYECAKLFHADIIVRVTADDPFKDPEIIDQAIDILLRGGYDYVSNTIEPTFPEGIDIEVFTISALKKAYNEAKLNSEKEHVTPYIWKNPVLFNIFNFKYSSNLSHLRWTLDTPEDFIFVDEVYKRLYNQESFFYMDDILSLLQKEPQLIEINTGIIRNAGYYNSLEKENLEKN